jgi:hypothetical protein
MAFFILLMISNTNKNIYGITNEILSLKSCSLNFFIPLMISNTYKNSNEYFASIKNCCWNKNNLKN